MMEWVFVLRWLHILGATVLLGTGAGIAFFMFMANRTGDAKFIAKAAAIVVTADWIFTASAVIIQPITGVLLAYETGWSLFENWIMLSLTLYAVTGLFWLPVVWVQYRLRDLARIAANGNSELPLEYHRLYRVWLICGVPAFISVLTIIWLMIVRPTI